MADLNVEVEFTEDIWDPTKGGGVTRFPDGIYQVKGTEVKMVTNPSSGKDRYEVYGEIVIPKEYAGQEIKTALFGDFSKEANVKKLKTALISAGANPKALVGKKPLDLSKAFVGRAYLLLVKNAPEGETVEYKGKQVPPLPEIDFVTKGQAEDYMKAKKAGAATPRSEKPKKKEEPKVDDMMQTDGGDDGSLDNIFAQS